MSYSYDNRITLESLEALGTLLFFWKSPIFIDDKEYILPLDVSIENLKPEKLSKCTGKDLEDAKHGNKILVILKESYDKLSLGERLDLNFDVLFAHLP